MDSSRIRLLWSFARPHTGTIALGLLLALFGSAAGLAGPLVTKWVLDTLDTSGSIVGPIVALVGLMISGALIGLRQWVLLGTLAERIVYDARAGMVRRFLAARVNEITSRSTGELVTRVTSDTLLLRQASSSSLVGLINGGVMLLGSLILMGVLDLPLLGVTIVVVAIVVALFVWLMPGIARAQEQSQEAVGRLGGSLEGTLRAIRTVKASVAEERQAARILEDARDAERYSVASVRRQALAWTISFTGIQGAIVVILGFGAWRVSEGRLDVSSLIAFLLYAFGLMGPIMEISQNLTAMQSGFAAAGRIREMQAIPLEAEATAAKPRAALTMVEPVDDAVIALHDVTFAYAPGAEPAVANITLAIPRRGHVALVGPSGAGKTTILSLMMRFLEPDEGGLTFNGRAYTEMTHQEIRRRLAYVEQETPIVPGTVRENVRYTHPDAAEEEIWRALREVRLEEKLRTLDDGLETSLVANALSGGQRQRVALARAILRTPEVLLLDEATAQVDGLTEAAIHAVIRERSERGAVVTIAHRLSTVIDADRIVVLENGRIRDQGTHDELLARDALYRDLVEALRIASAVTLSAA